MFHRPTPQTPGHKIRLDELNGPQLKGEIKELADSIIGDDQAPETKSPLDAESLVIAIHGGWGVGKTTAAWALINYFRQKEKKHDRQVHVQAFNLLPFGNINSSLNNILNTIANHLWEKSLLDVRKEFGRMLADATLQNDINAEIEFLGLKLKRKIALGKRNLNYKKSLERKFAYFKEGGHKLVIMIDDLDRMRPDEVIIVTRMVENFRTVPSIIFVLPFHRQIVASAIGQALNLDDPNSHAYLRKLIKSSISIDLTLENLQNSFMGTFRQGVPDIPRQLLGFDSALIAWYLLLHMILIKELVEIIRNPGRTDANLSLGVFLQKKSNYLPKLLNLCRSSTYAVKEKDAWQSLSNKYNALRYLADEKSRMGSITERVEGRNYEQLLRLIEAKEIYSPLCPKSEYTKSDRYVCNCSKPLEHSTFFSGVILPNIKKSRREILLTEEYSRRDMEQLAAAIRRDLCSKPPGDVVETEYLKRLSSVIKSRFMEFR